MIIENAVMWPLEQLKQLGLLRSLDLALSRYIAEETNETDHAVLFAIALTSERNGHGDVCLDLIDRVQNHELMTLPEYSELNAWLVSIKSLTTQDWWRRLSRSMAIQVVGSDNTDEESTSPLVLSGSLDRPRLYLRRYWSYEVLVRASINQRLGCLHEHPKALMHQLLSVLFASTQQQPDWQKFACALAARRSFAVITGGPGTGKTTTVVRLLALLQALALEQNLPTLEIALAAPTGKAAARLNASIAAQIESLPFDQLTQHSEQLKQRIPTEVTTLHRLLGPIHNSRRFRYHSQHPLPMDCIVVDEASMVDLEMLATLVSALKPTARLILLGDKDQLASVEAGAVLGDLCHHAVNGSYSEDTAEWLAQITGDQLPENYLVKQQSRDLDQAITMLRYSHRFSAEGGIGALAHLVNQREYRGQQVADSLAALKQIFTQQPEQLQQYKVNSATDSSFADLVIRGYRGYLETLTQARPEANADSTEFDHWAENVLKAHTQFQLLCAVREGPWGVNPLNSWITQILTKAALIKETQSLWYEGRPVLVTQNDYNLRLMNGDIGIALKRPILQGNVNEQGESVAALRVVFPTADGGVRWVMPSRLQAIETVFAMTVHKSQGSEFTHTALVLPDQPNPVLTQELIYTGITRSREKFSLIYSRETVLRQALTSRVKRLSGLTFN
ncbi:exodeoxyribonuclease V subunit alpha [Nitrincola schmidtii]|uniref:exodeoxyribonuclease V subunit alpha n=1 Tax=Nitrincola schmidtii TaxID=1730894 RepID=UPI00124CBF5C|nr:exodeoxyribonuclease V subunit alpha [Nitrincola schmidtii]